MSNDSVAFDRAADYYDNTRGFPPGVAADVGTLLVKTGGLTSSSRVLEIGVGTGRIALPVAPHIRAYYGIDLARPMLERLIAKRSTEPVYVVEGDVTRLPFPDAGFDAVIAVHIFHLIPAWREVLREVARVMRPGALLLHGWNDRMATNTLQGVWDKRPTTRARPRARSHGRSGRHFWRTTAGANRAACKLTTSRSSARRGIPRPLRQRRWSSTWRMSDADLQRGLAAVEAAIAAHYPDPTLPEANESAFKVQAYLPPISPCNVRPVLTRITRPPMPSAA